ncbi:MAG: hypothetical protein CSA20_05020 [Deltaproteobacteria bacterium]|nr:MAG: hypothetical protein CSB32_00630 [Desulfobacterales bacterium]PIE73042.1 MAG: hypothetical protein CSA20_05020 [Deltaproteobacteria bacterium]
MALKKLLNEVAVVPGVVGCCIVDRNKGVVCTSSESNVAAETLLKLGTPLLRMLKMGQINNLGPGECQFHFARCSVIGRSLTSRAVFLAVCDTDTNLSLIAATATLLAPDMREHLSRKDLSDRIESKDSRRFTVPEDNEAIDDEIRAFLSQIKKALAETIGPVAGMLLRDAVRQWQQEAVPDKSGFDRLLAIVSSEIGDTALRLEFRQKVSRLL